MPAQDGHHNPHPVLVLTHHTLRVSNLPAAPACLMDTPFCHLPRYHQNIETPP
ncbi:MAG: hypothetical protein SAMD01599839_04410 [Rectinema sp.]